MSKSFRKNFSFLLIFLLTNYFSTPLLGQALPKSLLSTPQPNLGDIFGGSSGQGIRSKGITNALPGERKGSVEMMGLGVGMEYQVHILGQVTTPGTYRVGPSVRAAEAIAIAGGVGERGAMRGVELRRYGKTQEKIDLFRFYEQGDLNANPFLQDNDVIFVPFRTQSIRVEGPVKKSGVFELAGEITVWDAIQLAGGFSVGVSQQSEVVIVRYENEKKQIIKIPNIAEELRRTAIENGDIIVVPHIFTKDKQFDYAFPNLPSDNVFYPSYNDQVFVAGAVVKEGPYEYQGHLTVHDYINLAGPDPRGKLKNPWVSKPDGSRVRNVKKYKLNPGDTIIVPQKKLTGGNFLTWYNTFASSLFTFVSLRSLMKDL